MSVVNVGGKVIRAERDLEGVTRNSETVSSDLLLEQKITND